MASLSRDLILLLQLILIFTIYIEASPQLDLPPISSTPRNGYGYPSTQSSINSPGNQFDLNTNFQYSTARPILPNTPGVFPVSSTPYSRINPDISNNGYPNLDYGNGRNPSSTVDYGRNPSSTADYGRNPSSTIRPYVDGNREDRIDINNDPNFRRTDPNFLRNDPNYVGSNPYDFNRGVDNNQIDNRFQQVNLQKIREFLVTADEQASKECTNNVAAQWNFETDVNDATQHAAVSTFLNFLVFFSL